MVLLFARQHGACPAAHPIRYLSWHSGLPLGPFDAGKLHLIIGNVGLS